MESKSFSFLGIDFFPCRTVTSLPEILRMDYEYFILDMGVLNTYTAKEFSRCDKQFLVCSLSKWKRKNTTEKIEHLLNNTFIQKEHLIILENLGKKESKLSISSGKPLMVLPFPFVENPFQLETRLFNDFENLLKGV